MRVRRSFLCRMNLVASPVTSHPQVSAVASLLFSICSRPLEQVILRQNLRYHFKQAPCNVSTRLRIFALQLRSTTTSLLFGTLWQSISFKLRIIRQRLSLSAIQNGYLKSTIGVPYTLNISHCIKKSRVYFERSLSPHRRVKSTFLKAPYQIRFLAAITFIGTLHLRSDESI